jgi:hypothetical protein
MDSPRSTKPQEIRLPCSFNSRTRYRKASNNHRPATLTSDKSLGDGAENEYGNEDRYAKGCLDDSSHLLPERLPSADRSQSILNTAGLHRESAARLC